MIYFPSRKTSDWLPKKVASIISQNENKGSIIWDITNYSDYDFTYGSGSWMQFYYWFFLLRRDISKQIIRKKIFDRA
jgi:hypothetical protein